MNKLPAYPVYGIYSGLMGLLRYMHFTVAALYYVTAVGMDPLQLILVGTTLMVVILLGEVPTGVLADTYSRRLSVIIGAALIGAGFLLEGLVAHFTVVLLAQLIWGLGVTFTSGALEAWIADECAGQDLDRIYLRGMQFSNAGALAGIGLAVALASTSLQVPMLISGLLGLALALFLLVAMPEHGFKPQPRGERSRWQMAQQTLGAGVRLVRGRRALLLILGVTACMGMASESFDRLWEVHFLAQTGFPQLAATTPVFWLGLINAGALLLSILAASLAQRRLNTASPQGLVRVLAGITVLLLVGMLGFGLAASFAVALAAYWMAYLMRRLYEPLHLAWVSQHSEPAVRATVLSLVGQVDAVGQIAGGPLFGMLAAGVSTGAAIVAASGVLLPALLLYRLALRGPQAASGSVAAGLET